MLIRPAMREVARVEGELDNVEQQMASLHQRLAALEACELPGRVAQFDKNAMSVERLQYDFDAQAANLQVERMRLDHAWQVLRWHARSLVSLGDLQAAALPRRAPEDLPAESVMISVIIATRNRASDLRVAVQSVQAQSWRQWEIVAVDDGSTDGTRQVLAELAAADPRIRWFTQPQLGHAVARNTAIDQARGDVVAYLDDDNEYYPDYLAALARTFAGDPDLEMAYAAQLWVGADAASMVTFDRFAPEALREMRMSLDVNALAHRVALRNRVGGFDPKLMRHADLDLVLRYAEATTPRRIPVIAVRYRWDTTPRISNTMSSIAALHRIKEKYVRPVGEGLRVLFVAYDYPQLSESYVHAEIRWMLSRGVQIEVHSRQAPVSKGEALVPVHYGNLDDVVARFQPHVIHVHWFSMAHQNAAALARYGLPVTIKGHGFDHTEELAADLLAQPWMFRMYVFDNLPRASIGGRSTFAQCRSAVDTSRYYPVYTKDRRLVLRAGACLPSKDLEMFVEVAARCPDYRFVMALSTNKEERGTEARIRARNEAFGHPVEILSDLQYEPMAELVRNAGVYLHTFGFHQPFAQPISIAEAMACGTIPLLRRSEATRAYTGDVALYYDTADEAAHILKRMLEWDDAQWLAAQRAAEDFAYARHADTVVLEPMLNDWLAARMASQARPDAMASGGG